MKRLLILFIIILTIVLPGCERTVDSPKGFSLPDGDEAKGEWVFTKYECIACHTIGTMQQPALSQMNISIGGDTTQVKTYADLLTSIINPSHKLARGYLAKNVAIDGKSKMVVYNDVMTIQELVDLVTFLQPKYKLVPYTKVSYPNYPYFNH